MVPQSPEAFPLGLGRDRLGFGLLAFVLEDFTLNLQGPQPGFDPGGFRRARIIGHDYT